MVSSVFTLASAVSVTVFFFFLLVEVCSSGTVVSLSVIVVTTEPVGELKRSSICFISEEVFAAKQLFMKSTSVKDHYIVPDYQREYVWKDEQIEQLTSDLIEAYNADNKKAYFLGTIVTYDAGSQFELIDGQQRLTTFFILLCAIKRIYQNNNEQTSLIENLIYNPIMRTCLHKNCMRIFVHDFVADKAKIRRRAAARQGFLTQYAAKFAEKTCAYAYEDRF